MPCLNWQGLFIWFKAISSEKVPFSIHLSISKIIANNFKHSGNYKIILDKSIYLCYNVFKIRE